MWTSFFVLGRSPQSKCVYVCMRIFKSDFHVLGKKTWPILVFNDVVYLWVFCGPSFFSVQTSLLVKRIFLANVSVHAGHCSIPHWLIRQRNKRSFSFFPSYPPTHVFLCPCLTQTYTHTHGHTPTTRIFSEVFNRRGPTIWCRDRPVKILGEFYTCVVPVCSIFQFLEKKFAQTLMYFSIGDFLI